jgi:hypothetical protein
MSIRPIVVLTLAACGGHGGVTPDAPPECTETDATACTGDTPACGPDHHCHGPCSADTDCLSGVCRADGTCTDPSTVLFVSRDVTGTTCTVDDKCKLDTALALADMTRNVIHMDPLGYQFASGFTFDRDVTIVGRGATIVVPANATNSTVFRVIQNHKIVLEMLSLGGSPPMVPFEGIECTNATLTAKGITIAQTSGNGINASGCFLRLERSTLHDNQLGAIVLGGGGIFAIFDNFIYKNGDATTSAGAIQMLGTVDAASRVEFNTIVDNHAAAGATNSGGIICDQDLITLPNNLIARNDVGGNTTVANAQTVGACTYPTSIIQADVTGLAFSSPDAQPFDYHINTGSLAIDQATTITTVVYDHDFQPRPFGLGSDIGADELTSPP